MNPYYFIRQYLSWERLYYLSLWFWEHFGMWWRSSSWDDYGPVCLPCQSTLLYMLCLTSSWFTLQCFHNFINSVFGFDVFAICTAVCKVNVCLMYISGVTSAWILVAMTAQRAASVLWPRCVNVVCSLRKPLCWRFLGASCFLLPFSYMLCMNMDSLTLTMGQRRSAVCELLLWAQSTARGYIRAETICRVHDVDCNMFLTKARSSETICRVNVVDYYMFLTKVRSHGSIFFHFYPQRSSL